MNSNSSIQDIVHSIDIEKYNSIEKERVEVQSTTAFQKWCKKYKVGSRVEVKDYRALELQMQYEQNYPKWISRKY